MYIQCLRNVAHIVTCHDMLAVRAGLGEIPGLRVGWMGRLFQRLIRKGLAQAQACNLRLLGHER